tara:strand:+ start:1366 stop:1467 length:102 start_codon:yes stop_codon:yes gene_type:complete
MTNEEKDRIDRNAVILVVVVVALILTFFIIAIA